jgi:hypothetical protein
MYCDSSDNPHFRIHALLIMRKKKNYYEIARGRSINTLIFSCISITRYFVLFCFCFFVFFCFVFCFLFLFCFIFYFFWISNVL